MAAASTAAAGREGAGATPARVELDVVAGASANLAANTSTSRVATAAEMTAGQRVKWVNKSEWVTWVTGQYILVTRVDP